jgi:hypothetical protein
MTIIPAEALKNHIGIIGKTGSGKTFAAKGIVESLLDAGERVCIVDPASAWWGLKSKASGKAGAYRVVIFGGDHADLPLGAVHGEAIAEIVATSNTPAIIDTSLMKVGERTRFFTDFASELLRKNKGPLHLFIDECHLFCPQGRVADPQSGNMLHAANNLISLGRSKGLRVTLISQRPAKVHKDSLTQIETMIAMRLIAPQDRRAVEDWIADQADQQKGKDIIASLPSLSKGQGWVWAPELGILKKVTFPRIKTFDSGSTPEGFGDGSGPVLAAIDMATISTKLVAIKEEADANDPVKLKARIRDLEKSPSAAEPDSKAQQKAQAEGFKNGYSKAFDDCRLNFAASKATLASMIFDKISKFDLSPSKHTGKQDMRELADAIIPSAREPTRAIVDLDPFGVRNAAGDLSRAQQRVVDALGFWASVGHRTPSRAQVAAVSGYSVKSSGFEKTVSQLSTAGVISRPVSGALALVDQSKANLMDLAEARAKLLSVLGPAQRRVLDAFNGTSATRDEIAERSQYSNTSSGFEKTLSQLSSIGVVTRPAPGMVDLADWVRELL